jgi:Holliday junction resolvasome RuvABC endonuclease subunit
MGLVVIETRATSARKAALGNGGLAKDKVWEIMRKRYPELFAPKTRGGLDECDALVLALAGERVAER